MSRKHIDPQQFVDIDGVLLELMPKLKAMGAAELSRVTGLALNSVAMILRGERAVTIGTLGVLADAVGCRLELRLVHRRAKVAKPS